MIFRRAPILLAAVLVLASAGAADVQLVRVWPAWRDGPSFKRISEYFNGVENTAGWAVRRTDPQSREGYYFTVRVKNTAPKLAGAKFVLRIITPTSPDPQVFPFDADLPQGSTVFELGLTGANWPGKNVLPVAWRLELFDADGTLLAAQQSFLWGTP